MEFGSREEVRAGSGVSSQGGPPGAYSSVNAFGRITVECFRAYSFHGISLKQTFPNVQKIVKQSSLNGPNATLHWPECNVALTRMQSLGANSSWK